jgi:hypothetical protein
MILFVAHDPGATNHVTPVFAHAVRLGEQARFIDLAAGCRPQEVSEITAVLCDGPVSLLVTGCSENKAEWPWVKAARRLGIRTAMIVDVGVGGGMMGVHTADFPDRFLVTGENCAEELRELGCPSDRVNVTGSTHLEVLSMRGGLEEVRRTVKNRYGLDSGRSLVSFFLSSCDAEVGVVSHLHSLLASSCLHKWLLVIRPHPRNSRPQVAAWEQACQGLKDVRLDMERAVDTPSLLVGSVMSLAMASSISAESLVLGTPSAFFQIGWDYRGLDRLYRNLDFVPRLRTEEQVHRFVAMVVRGQFNGRLGNLESHTGATARGWQVLCELA